MVNTSESKLDIYSKEQLAKHLPSKLNHATFVWCFLQEIFKIPVRDFTLCQDLFTDLQVSQQPSYHFFLICVEIWCSWLHVHDFLKWILILNKLIINLVKVLTILTISSSAFKFTFPNSEWVNDQLWVSQFSIIISTLNNYYISSLL